MGPELTLGAFRGIVHLAAATASAALHCSEQHPEFRSPGDPTLHACLQVLPKNSTMVQHLPARWSISKGYLPWTSSTVDPQGANHRRVGAQSGASGALPGFNEPPTPTSHPSITSMPWTRPVVSRRLLQNNSLPIGPGKSSINSSDANDPLIAPQSVGVPTNSTNDTMY